LEQEFLSDGTVLQLVEQLGAKHTFFEPVLSKHEIILPRQARDKHTQERVCVFIVQGITAMTYFPKMKKLIAVTETTCLGCGVRVDFDFDTYILEADSPDGTIPGASKFKLVTYQQHFGPQSYFVHIPSRFSPDGGPGYMCMAANFAEGSGTVQVDGVTRRKMSAVINPTGGTYGINLQATQFCGPKAGVACTMATTNRRDTPYAHAGGLSKGQNQTGLAAAQTDAADDPPNPDYPLGHTAAAIWVDTNIVTSRTNASAAGFASFNITRPSGPFSALAARLFEELVGAVTYRTGVSFYNITSPNQFAPVGPGDKSTLGVLSHKQTARIAYTR
jgi:hypothetical protein